jgi:NhaA family Na+:H+ antiporter
MSGGVHEHTYPASALRDLLISEAAGGIVLIGAASVALALANSPAAPTYFGVLRTYVGGLSLLHWINDALMSVFFLLIGLEIKREFLDGQLSSWRRRMLPGIAAAGGMVAPGLIYFALNAGNSLTLRGWAIPTATDIAFALGVLAMLGPRVPVSLKIFLTALAILDDLGAITIIAALYTDNLALGWLGLAGLALFGLCVLNRSGSGVHATLAGVALALTIPLCGSPAGSKGAHSPLHTLEHGIQPWVAFLVVPTFGFANAGVSFAGMKPADLLQPVPLGIAAGLFIGKKAGILISAWAAVRLGLAARPDHASWAQLFGVSLICGIGFTMSLFIGLLAFPDHAALQDQVKVGVLIGSLFSGAIGALVLALASRRATLVLQPVQQV